VTKENLEALSASLQRQSSENAIRASSSHQSEDERRKHSLDRELNCDGFAQRFIAAHLDDEEAAAAAPEPPAVRSPIRTFFSRSRVPKRFRRGSDAPAEDDGRVFDMLNDLQGRRLDEQRSSLPPSSRLNLLLNEPTDGSPARQGSHTSRRSFGRASSGGSLAADP
jgi:hypothetical protein